MLLWALWLVIGALTLNPFAALPQGGPVYAWRLLGRALGVTMTLLAAIVLVGAAAGSQDVLRPLAVFAGGQASASPGAAAASAGPDFGRVASVAQLDQALQSGGKPAMLDFYADWCTSCKEMDRLTLTDPRVRARLSQMNLVRADVTDNGPDAQALLKRFSLFGPPAIILFDAQGHEVGRVVGEQPADTFLRSLDQAYHGRS
jgi:thiol:disulfide interchange protein DsbD